MGELSKYKWTGHTYILGKNKNDFQMIDEVLLRFSSKRNKALEGYKRYIADGWSMGERRELEGGGLLRSAGGLLGIQKLKDLKERWQGDARLLGDGDFVMEMLKESEEKLDIRNKLRARGWNLERLRKKIEDEFELGKKELQSGRRYRFLTIPKGVFCYLGSEQLGYSLEDLGRYLQMSRQSVLIAKGKGEGYIKVNKESSIC